MAPRQGGRRALWVAYANSVATAPATAEEHCEGNCAVACMALCRAYGGCKRPADFARRHCVSPSSRSKVTPIRQCPVAPRSNCSTELGLIVDGPSLASKLADLIQRVRMPASFTVSEVPLRGGLRWSFLRDGRRWVLHRERESNWASDCAGPSCRWWWTKILCNPAYANCHMKPAARAALPCKQQVIASVTQDYHSIVHVRFGTRLPRTVCSLVSQGESRWQAR